MANLLGIKDATLSFSDKAALRLEKYATKSIAAKDKNGDILGYFNISISLEEPQLDGLLSQLLWISIFVLVLAFAGLSLIFFKLTSRIIQSKNRLKKLNSI